MAGWFSDSKKIPPGALPPWKSPPEKSHPYKFLKQILFFIHMFNVLMNNNYNRVYKDFTDSFSKIFLCQKLRNISAGIHQWGFFEQWSSLVSITPICVDFFPSVIYQSSYYEDALTFYFLFV